MGDIRFDGRVAVVTGAGQGLGRAHALLLAARGAAVVVNDVDGALATRTADEIVAGGGRAVADAHTVATPAGGEAVVAAAVEAFGAADIVVNNAGILRDRAFHNLAPDDVRAVLDVHLLGAFWVTRPAWTLMRERGYGRVVITTSSAGLLGNAGQANYGAAKMGLVGLTRVLAAEGRRHNIGVNAVAPLARTAMTEPLLGALGAPAARLDPQLVAPLVAWLCAEDCGASGEVYAAGGGRVARFFVGLTEGFADPDLTPEAVRDNRAAIDDRARYRVFASAADHLGDLVSRLS